MSSWLLPENIADMLPAETRRVESYRRTALDILRRFGYVQVQPPLLEYLDSLLTGAAGDARNELNLRTFKLVDQLSGRTLGVRADMTPQVARIDAHLLNRRGVTRLCYVGSLLHTRPLHLLNSREPLQLGAEIYGAPSLGADLEILHAVWQILQMAKVGPVRLDLAHVGVLEGLLALAPELHAQETEILNALLAKDKAELQGLTADCAPTIRQALVALPDLYGALDLTQIDNVLVRARALLPSAPIIQQALTELENMARLSAQTLLAQDESVQRLQICVDLADLRGYSYHTGLCFAAYTRGLPNALARGGRYDAAFASFGRARPATGFSLDLRELANLPLATQTAAYLQKAILAPALDLAAPGFASLWQTIAQLRQQGEVVIQQYAGSPAAETQEFICDRQLVAQGNAWVVVTQPE